MRCHWHGKPDFCVRISIISRRIRSTIQKLKKGCNLWIRGPWGIVWWKKTEGRKSRDTVPLRNQRSGHCHYVARAPKLANVNGLSITAYCIYRYTYTVYCVYGVTIQLSCSCTDCVPVWSTASAAILFKRESCSVHDGCYPILKYKYLMTHCFASSCCGITVNCDLTYVEEYRVQ
jgi:hypothetical protein